MTKAFLQIIYLHIILAICLYVISQSFQFFPFFSISTRDTFTNFTLFFLMFSIPISFIIFMFGVTKNESE